MQEATCVWPRSADYSAATVRPWPQPFHQPSPLLSTLHLLLSARLLTFHPPSPPGQQSHRWLCSDVASPSFLTVFILAHTIVDPGQSLVIHMLGVGRGSSGIGSRTLNSHLLLSLLSLTLLSTIRLLARTLLRSTRRRRIVATLQRQPCRFAVGLDLRDGSLGLTRSPLPARPHLHRRWAWRRGPRCRRSCPCGCRHDPGDRCACPCL